MFQLASKEREIQEWRMEWNLRWLVNVAECEIIPGQEESLLPKLGDSLLPLHSRNHCTEPPKSGIFKLSPSNQTDSHEVQNFMQEGS